MTELYIKATSQQTPPLWLVHLVGLERTVVVVLDDAASENGQNRLENLPWIPFLIVSPLFRRKDDCRGAVQRWTLFY
jgi:hypothetical protein